MTPEQIRSDVEYLDACIRNIHESASDRALTDAENTDWKAGLAERARLVSLLERHAEVSRLSAIPAHIEDGDGAKGAPQIMKRDANPFDLSDLSYGATVGEIRSKALAAVDKVGGLEDRHREQAEALVRSLPPEVAKRVVLTGSEAYRSAFQKMAGGAAHLLNSDERDALERAASLTGANGGFAVPFTLDPTIIDTGTHSVNPIRQVATVKQTVTNSWNGVSSAGVTASWDAEFEEVSDDAPTLAQLAIPVFKGQAFVPFSVEVGGDWANIESDLRSMIAVAKDDLEGAAFIAGNGTTQPQGITTALDGTASEIAPTTAETFAVADVYKVEAALEARYRARAAWLGNKVWYNAIRAFDTSGSGALWEQLAGAQPNNLLGYPVYESSNMDAVLPNAAASADNFGLILGDWSQYYIVDRVGLTVELVPHLFATGNNRPNGSRGFLAWWRVGGEPVNVKAFAMLSIPTAA